MTKAYRAIDIARYIVAGLDRAAGESITPLKLQKLLYYIQAWALVFLGRPLFNEDFEAWAHGPAVESVYQEYKAYKWDAIAEGLAPPDIDDEAANHIESILGIYGDFSAKHLETMTHQEAPWRDARGDLPAAARSSAIISKKSMRDFYSELYEKMSDGEEPETTENSRFATKESRDVAA